jgi:ABC-2 type transport system permease protein
MFYVIDWIGGSAGGLVKDVLEYVSLVRRYQDFVKGIIDVKSVVYYLSFATFALFLSKAALDGLRIRA